MAVSVPPAIENELASIAEAPEGEILRKLLALTRARGADSDEVLAAQLAGVFMNPVAYVRLDNKFTRLFTDGTNLTLANIPSMIPTLIIGSGYHAAVFAAIWYRRTGKKPYVIEASDTVGGVFAVSQRPSFVMNSEIASGAPGYPWERGANDLNWLPGGPVQACQLTSRELADNTVPRYMIRAALTLYAKVITRATAAECRIRPPSEFVPTNSWDVTLADGRLIRALRVIDCRGGGPEKATGCDGKRILTWSQAMGQMDTDFPYANIRRMAVIGGGNSGLCAAESALGIGPDVTMRTAASGMPRVDIFSTTLPGDRQNWFLQVQSRYVRLGSHLPVGLETENEEGIDVPVQPRGYGKFHDMSVIPELGAAVAVPDGVLVNGRLYDAVVMANGHNPPPELLRGTGGGFEPYSVGGRIVGLQAQGGFEFYRVGPCARLDWQTPDFTAGVNLNPANKDAMFRLGPLTATLAASLPVL